MTLLQRLQLSSKLVETIIGEKDFNSDQKIFYFTGRGIGNANYHLGHYFLNKVLNQSSKSANVPIVYQLSSDEKRGAGPKFKSTKVVKQYTDSTLYNMSHVFDGQIRVFDNLDLDNMMVIRNCADYINSKIKLKTYLDVFGNISGLSCNYVGIQLAPLVLLGATQFKDYTPIIVTAADQKGFFSLFRDICGKLGLKKPIVIILKPLKDIKMEDKMSSSSLNKAVLCDFNGFEKILKAVSDPKGENDFCREYILKMLEIKPCSELTALLLDYSNTKNSLGLKTKLIAYLQKTYQLINPLSPSFILSAEFLQKNNLSVNNKKELIYRLEQLYLC